MEKLLKELKEKIHYDPFSGFMFWLPHTYAFKKAKTQGRLTNGLAVVGNIGNHGYMYINANNTSRLLHRLAWFFMTGSLPPQEVDHINRDKLDNRFCNLRIASSSQNKMNRGPAKIKNNGCLYKGVRWSKRDHLWMASIKINGKPRHLGCFKTQEEAARAYDAAAKLHHREFARLNFTDPPANL